MADNLANVDIFSGKLEADTPVRLVNRTEETYFFDYIRTRYVSPPKKQIYITWKVACAWFGDPNTRDSKGNPDREVRIKNVQLWFSFFSDEWDVWLETKPALEVYSMNGERIIMAWEDKAGQNAPNISSGMSGTDMDIRMANLERELELLRANKASDGIVDDIVLPNSTNDDSIARIVVEEIPDDISHFDSETTLKTPEDNQDTIVSTEIPTLSMDTGK